MSQFSSAPRVKTDLLGDQTLTHLSECYKTFQLIPFKEECKKAIMVAIGKKEKKLIFIRLIDSLSTKEAVLQKTYNYILAGMGLAV